jgi:glycosyltransferase involved in cell wall biosynthesis
MKILIVLTPSFNPSKGGVQRVTYNLGKYFTKSGHEVAYFSFCKDGHIQSVYGHLYHPEKSGIDINIKYLKEVQKSFEPNIIINQMPYERALQKVMFGFKTNSKAKVTTCIHNSLFSFKSNIKDIMKRVLPKPFNTLMATDILSNFPLFYHKVKHRSDLLKIFKSHDTTLLFTPSNYEELKYFLSYKDLLKVNVDFMPNPIIDCCEVVPEKEKVILHVGRINIPQKRSDLLLDFWEKVYKELPEWQFKIVGSGPYLDTLKDDLKKRGLARVELLGFQKPEKYYKEASIFMMPSAYEGFPNTILEAQSYGCPVLAFNSYVALEWIVGSKNKELLSAPYELDHMAENCLDLARNRDYLKNMQFSAIENVQRFKIEKIVEKWENLFDKLCKT